MATCSSILAWRIPRTEEPGGLQSIGLQSQTQRRQLSTCTHLNPERVKGGYTCLETQYFGGGEGGRDRLKLSQGDDVDENISFHFNPKERQ